LIATVAAWITSTISTLGYGGIVVLMAIESACIPLPSEIIMPFAGYLASIGRFSLWGVALAGAIGCNLGSLIAYWVGAWGGRRFIDRWGRYVLLTHDDIVIAERFFARFGSAAIFVGRLLPMVRTFIALPAGIARMPQALFHLLTFAGSFIWCYLLAYIGAQLGQRWDSDPRLRDVLHQFDIVVVLLALAAIGVFLWHKLGRSARARS
jgi:membrane protein DedA with SNARE-associated domain